MFKVFGHLHFYFFTVRISDVLLVTAKIDIVPGLVPSHSMTSTPLANGHEQYSTIGLTALAN